MLRAAADNRLLKGLSFRDYLRAVAIVGDFKAHYAGMIQDYSVQCNAKPCNADQQQAFLNQRD